MWIIDPLDGTNEFGEPGRPDWAVHVALVVDGEPAAAAVALPAVGRTFVTNPAPTVPPAGDRRPRIVTSRFRSPQAAVAAQVLGADVVRLGSAGAKTMAVVMGHADVYAHHGGMYEWDSAAPAAVAAAAGLHVSRIDGSPLVYNNPIPGSPTSWSAGPSWPSRSSARCGAEPMELKATHVEVAGAVATVWLHRPDRHNAWTGRMHAEYRWIAELEADESVRAVVVTGTPPAFCVGGDSGALAGHAARGGRDPGLPTDPAARVRRPGRARPRLRLALRPAPPRDRRRERRLRRSGPGPGALLRPALRERHRELTTAAPRLGLPAEFGLSWVLPRLVGVPRAADLLLSGRVVTGADTADWGLWNAVAPDGEERARRGARVRPPPGGRVAGQCCSDEAPATDDLLSLDVGASVEESKRLLDRMMGGADYREGVAALREKRPPRF